jgi:hypothetical protein
MAKSRGRPPRQDWMPAHGLRSVPPGTLVMLRSGRKKPGRGERGRVDHYSSVNDHVYLTRHDGTTRGFSVCGVLKWREVSSIWNEGDLVCLHGDSAWRGVVKSVLDEGVVEVETGGGVQLRLEDELYSAATTRSARPESPWRGPMSTREQLEGTR